ncbi:MAG: hypothetical protein AAB952_00170 [Patescibacteria group bacterium]
MKPEASWWFDNIKKAALDRDSEQTTEEVKKEAKRLAKDIGDNKKFPNNLSVNPPKSRLRKWEDKNQ